MASPDSAYSTQVKDRATDEQETGLMAEKSKSQEEKEKKRRAKARLAVHHVDIIRDEFWDPRPWLLSNKPGKIPKEP